MDTAFEDMSLVQRCVLSATNYEYCRLTGSMPDLSIAVYCAAFSTQNSLLAFFSQFFQKDHNVAAETRRLAGSRKCTL